MTAWDIVTVLALCCVAWAWGWWSAMRLHTKITMALFRALGLTEQQLRSAGDRVIAQLKVDALRDQGINIIDVRLEQHQGLIFAYRVDTAEFLGQGSNRDELISSIARRIPGAQMRVSEDSGMELIK